MDFKRFRVYLKDKYLVEKAFLFIGYLERNQKLYTFLQKVGYICVFKPTLEYKDGTTKGNCDAELVLHAMIEYQNYNKAVIVTGDGDFYCLVDHLKEKNKLKQLFIPNRRRYSALLKTINSPDKKYMSFVSDQRNKLEYIKKGPDKNKS